jgi:transcriptional regulator with XRE-family HTH domain
LKVTKKNQLRAKEIGARIKQARQEAGGMTQRELGDLIGVTERSVAAYEAGEVVPYRFLRALESALAKPAEWILDGEQVRQNAVEENQQLILAKLDELLEQNKEILLHLKGNNDGATKPRATRKTS